MTPTRTLTLALVCAVALTCVQTAHAQIGTTCTITGTVYQVDGITPAARATLTVTRADKAGKLYANTSRVYTANSNGIITFKTPRTIGTDTAVIHVKASFGNLAAGQILYVPSDSTATLESLVRYTANPQFVVVAVPTNVSDSTQTIFNPSGTQKIPASRLDVGAITGDTTGTTNQPMQGRFEDALGQFTAGTSDSIQQNAANAYVARNVAEGKAGADSVHTVLVSLSNLIAGKGSADSIHSQLVTLYDLVAGKPSADSVHTAIAAMLKMSDTTALHAQRFSVINDSLLAVSLRATTTKNDLTAHASTADAHLPSQTGASGKFLQSNGTVSSWQPEADPTVALRIRDSLALYNLPWMRGDTATIGRILDGMYPRSGGGAAVDTTRLMPGFAGQTKTYPGSITMSSGGVSAPNGTVSAKTVVGDSLFTRAYVMDSTYAASDSVHWRVYGHRLPWALHPDSANYKTGVVNLEIHLHTVSGNTKGGAAPYRSFVLSADSANGVTIIGAYTTIEKVGSDLGSMTEWYMYTNANTAPMTLHSAGGQSPIPLLRAVSYSHWYIQLSSNTWFPDYTVEMRVRYKMPLGSTSLSPIIVTSNR